MRKRLVFSAVLIPGMALIVALDGGIGPERRTIGAGPLDGGKGPSRWVTFRIGNRDLRISNRWEGHEIRKDFYDEKTGRLSGIFRCARARLAEDDRLWMADPRYERFGSSGVTGAVRTTTMRSREGYIDRQGAGGKGEFTGGVEIVSIEGGRSITLTTRSIKCDFAAGRAWTADPVLIVSGDGDTRVEGIGMEGELRLRRVRIERDAVVRLVQRGGTFDLPLSGRGTPRRPERSGPARPLVMRSSRELVLTRLDDLGNHHLYLSGDVIVGQEGSLLSCEELEAFLWSPARKPGGRGGEEKKRREEKEKRREGEKKKGGGGRSEGKRASGGLRRLIARGRVLFSRKGLGSEGRGGCRDLYWEKTESGDPASPAQDVLERTILRGEPWVQFAGKPELSSAAPRREGGAGEGRRRHPGEAPRRTVRRTTSRKLEPEAVTARCDQDLVYTRRTVSGWVRQRVDLFGGASLSRPGKTPGAGPSLLSGRRISAFFVPVKERFAIPLAAGRRDSWSTSPQLRHADAAGDVRIDDESVHATAMRCTLWDLGGPRLVRLEGQALARLKKGKGPGSFLGEGQARRTTQFLEMSGERIDLETRGKVRRFSVVERARMRQLDPSPGGAPWGAEAGRIEAPEMHGQTVRGAPLVRAAGASPRAPLVPGRTRDLLEAFVALGGVRGRDRTRTGSCRRLTYDEQQGELVRFDGGFRLDGPDVRARAAAARYLRRARRLRLVGSRRDPAQLWSLVAPKREKTGQKRGTSRKPRKPGEGAGEEEKKSPASGRGSAAGPRRYNYVEGLELDRDEERSTARARGRVFGRVYLAEQGEGPTFGFKGAAAPAPTKGKNRKRDEARKAGRGDRTRKEGKKRLVPWVVKGEDLFLRLGPRRHVDFIDMKRNVHLYSAEGKHQEGQGERLVHDGQTGEGRLVGEPGRPARFWSQGDLLVSQTILFDSKRQTVLCPGGGRLEVHPANAGGEKQGEGKKKKKRRNEKEKRREGPLRNPGTQEEESQKGKEKEKRGRGEEEKKKGKRKEPGREKGDPVTILCNGPIRFLAREHRGDFTRDVRILAGGSVISCKTMQIDLDPKTSKVRGGLCRTDVVVETPRASAYGDRLRWDAAARRGTLTGTPQARSVRGNTVTYADEIVVDTRDDSLTERGNVFSRIEAKPSKPAKGGKKGKGQPGKGKETPKKGERTGKRNKPADRGENDERND